MGHIKFKCRMPPKPPPNPPYPTINQPLPSVADCEVIFVDDHGAEHTVEWVTRFTFDTGEPGDVVRARLEIQGAEVDIESPILAGDPVLSGPYPGRVVGWTRPSGPIPEAVPPPVRHVRAYGRKIFQPMRDDARPCTCPAVGPASDACAVHGGR